MIQVSLVIFRELLEILLLFGVIVAGVSSKFKNSNLYILIGSLIGVFMSITLAIVTPLVSEMFGGLGQEIFNSGIIFITAIMIGVTVIWMQNYSAKIKHEINHVANNINENFKHKLSFILLIGMTIFREGSEIVLFLYSKALSLQASFSNYLLAIAAGSASAILCGILFYKGLIKVNRIFKFTSVLLIIIASSLVAEAFGILGSSGIIPVFIQEAWDLSFLIPNESVLGQILNVLINYNAKPSILQVLAFISTFTIISIISKLVKKTSKNTFKPK